MLRSLGLAALIAAASAPALAQDKVTFGTDWKAEAEHGGYYQAIATGIYRQHGLEVTLRQGGPQVNHAQLLAAGRLDFNDAPNSFIAAQFRARERSRWSRWRRSSRRTLGADRPSRAWQ